MCWDAVVAVSVAVRVFVLAAAARRPRPHFGLAQFGCRAPNSGVAAIMRVQPQTLPLIPPHSLSPFLSLDWRRAWWDDANIAQSAFFLPSFILCLSMTLDVAATAAALLPLCIRFWRRRDLQFVMAKCSRKSALIDCAPNCHKRRLASPCPASPRAFTMPIWLPRRWRQRRSQQPPAS